MDDGTQLGAELTKINFLLENLYAIVLRNAGAGSGDIAALADEVRRQFTELPDTRYGGGPADPQAIQEVAAARLDTFFARVRDRLLSEERRPG